MAIVEGTNAGFVLVAPTADPGGIGTRVDSYAKAVKFTSPANAASINRIGWYCSKQDGFTRTYVVGIYSHDPINNMPDVLLASASASVFSIGWKYMTVNLAILPNTIYWIAVQVDDNGGDIDDDFSVNASYKYDRKDSQTTLPNPWGLSDITAGYIRAIYARYLTDVPTVTAINPNSGLTTGGTPVTISGTNFISGATVTIDGNPATDVTIVNDTTITAVTPAGSAGAKDVVVTTSKGQGTLAGGFTYSLPPTTTTRRAEKGLICGYNCFMRQYIDFTNLGLAPLKLPDGTLW